MAEELGASIEIMIVMQGKKQGYSIQLKLTMPMPKGKEHNLAIGDEPDLDSFIDGLYFLNKQRIYKDEKGDDLLSQSASFSTKAETLNA